jgi:hypothetical protein
MILTYNVVMLTSITINKTLLQTLDQIRKQRGIRTRAKALEIVLTEAVETDPLEKIWQSPKSTDAIPKKVLQQLQKDREARAAGQIVKTTSYEEVKARLERKRNAT